MSNTIPNISDGIWDDIKIILEYMVIKNKQLADSYETGEMQRAATVYFAALNHSGSIMLYKDYLTYELFASIMPGKTPKFIMQCLDNPILVPSQYREPLLKHVEGEIVKTYTEKNDYYRTLIGLPPYATKPSDYLYLHDYTYEEYDIEKIESDGIERYPAIHELDTFTQDVIKKSADYKQLKADHPNDEWLNYIGSDKILLQQARDAKEFEIIRLFPGIDSPVNSELVRHFADEYNRSREWITRVMWNADMEQASIHYRQFVGLAIMVKALRMTLNRQFDGVLENSFLNDSLITILFDLYRLPQSLAKLPKSNKRQLALELRKIIRDRASNKVLYDIARIFGFDNITISKIVLNKFQKFEGDNDQVVHEQIENVVDPLTNETTTVDDPYHSYIRQMQAINIKAPYPNNEILKQQHLKDYVYGVTDPDPRWWEDNNPRSEDGIYPKTPDGYLRNEMDEIKKKEFNPQMFKTQIFGNPEADIPTTDETAWDYDEIYWNTSTEIRRHPSWYLPGYNSVDTKYIMLTYQYSMSEKMFEMIYLMRYMLDNKKKTQTYQFMLPTYGGTDPHSLYDIILFMVCGLNRMMFGTGEYKDNDYGQIINNDTGYRSIIGYNVDILGKPINEYLSRCQYLDKGTIQSFIEETIIGEVDDIPSGYALGILGLRDYLVSKMEMAKNITEWRECEKFYNMIFTYDPIRDVHAKGNKDEYTPAIRYTIYDMEVGKFNGVTARVGDMVKITLTTVDGKNSENHTVVVGFVSEVSSDGCITEINFRTPNAATDRNALPVWNNPMYNAKSDIALISDVRFDKGELYNPSGSDGLSPEESCYKATINDIETDLLIRVCDTRYHTQDLFETYQDELVRRDPWLADFVSGNYSDADMSKRLMEACDVIGEAFDMDFRYYRLEFNGGENMETYLMDMIKYIKSYTIDFITSEKKYVLNDKRNPEWLRMMDAIMFDPSKPVVLYPRSFLMTYDAIKHMEQHSIIYDGKRFPKDQWDLEPFEKGSPYMVDKIKIFRGSPKIQYYYTIDDIIIEQLTLPEGLDRGTRLADFFVVKDIFTDESYRFRVDIYIGNNPPKKDFYHETDFVYKIGKATSFECPVMININNDNFPQKLPDGFIPDYGKSNSSEAGYFIATTTASFSKVDMGNHQNM